VLASTRRLTPPVRPTPANRQRELPGACANPAADAADSPELIVRVRSFVYNNGTNLQGGDEHENT
jgi:hypothetical protein